MSQPIAPDRGSRPWLRPLGLLLVALVALGGAGWSIWRSVGDEAIQQLAAYQRGREAAHRAAVAPPQPAPRPANRPIEDEELASWTDLAIFAAGPDRPRPVVVVHRPLQSTGNNDGIARGVLAREIIRQGVILAAREGFDVVVRDVAAGDPVESGTASATYRLGLYLHDKKRETPDAPHGVRITIVSGTGPKRVVVWHQMLDAMGFEVVNYPRLVSQVEVLVRTDFRQVLAGWKLPPNSAPIPPRQPNALPEGVEPRLVSLAETDQIVALRDLHDAIRRDGGSPVRWLALARGYALLGSLTEPLLSASHAVFKARGLLYAQQAVVVEKDSPASLREQAFAEAMAGIFSSARSDLALADKADGGKEIPLRAEVTRAFVASDPVTLRQLAARSAGDLTPLYLAAVVESRISGDVGSKARTCRNEVITALDAVLARVSDCHRIIDIMCAVSGVANSHRATTLDLETFAETSAQRVAILPGLPPGVTGAIGTNPSEADEFNVRQALVKAAATDTNDLSWGTLAQILRETRFLQVTRRLYFLAYPLGSGAPEFVEQARPLIADHPNHDFIELYGGLVDQVQASKVIDGLDMADLETKNYSLLQPIRTIDQERSNALFRWSIAQSDWGVVFDCERIARHQGEGHARTAWSNALLSIDPTSPAARCLITDADWTKAAPKIADWEREQPWNTALIGLHGLQLVNEKRYSDAQALLETALGRSPELWIFEGLVDCYQGQDQVDRWEKAVEALLTQPDQALDHAHATNNLAKYLMDHGQVDRAWPWAEKAAESWAGWAMVTASQCAEMRRDWDNAEAWIARLAERYDSSWLDWLAWCVRTGQGHRDEAARRVWARWDANRQAATLAQAQLLEQLALVLDRVDIARQVAETQLQADPTSTADGIMLALACDRLGDTKAREAALDQIMQQPQPAAPRTARVVTALVTWHRHREIQALDLAPVEAILNEMPADRRPMGDTITGLLLMMFGQPDAAVPYLKASDVGSNNIGTRLQARQVLQQRGLPLEDYLFDAPIPRP